MSKLPNQTASNTEITTITAQETTQFPSISRFIPEKLNKASHKVWYSKLLIVSFISGLLLLGITLELRTLLINIHQLKDQNEQRIQINAAIQYWKKVVKQYQGYEDAYLKLASLEYKLGNTIEAKQYIDKAFTIDPNSKEGKVLGAKIHAVIH